MANDLKRTSLGFVETISAKLDFLSSDSETEFRVDFCFKMDRTSFRFSDSTKMGRGSLPD